MVMHDLTRLDLRAQAAVLFVMEMRPSSGSACVNDAQPSNVVAHENSTLRFYLDIPFSCLHSKLKHHFFCIFTSALPK